MTPAEPSVWRRRVTIDWAKLASTITSGAISAIADSAKDPTSTVAIWRAVASTAVGALGTLRIDTTVEQRLWLLLHRSLVGAMFELLAGIAQVDFKDIDETHAAALGRNAITANETWIDEGFFESPQKLPLLTHIAKPFATWLQDFGVTESAANSIAGRLPSYFALALHQEWRAHPENYQVVLNKHVTPFTIAARWELAWRHQSAALQQMIDQPMFGEAFSLAQVYVPPRAFWEVRNTKADGLATPKTIPNELGRHERIAVDLESQLDTWIKNNDRDDAIRVISGGPGSGKSAFARIFAARRAGQGDHVVLIPLHMFDVSAELDKGVQTFVDGAGILPSNPLSGDASGVAMLIVFDGLDELEKQGKGAEQTAREFVEHVILRVRQLNQTSSRVRVLLSGRELAVQTVQNDFRRDGTVLHLLPYYVSDRQLTSTQDIAKVDQRNLWWQRYGEATGAGFSAMPEELRRTDLDEVTSQPLLCYLVAVSWAGGELDFRRATTRSAIYRDLLKAVFKRSYDKAGPAPGARRLELDQFILGIRSRGCMVMIICDDV